jgi:hypothetical protein
MKKKSECGDGTYNAAPDPTLLKRELKILKITN